MLNIIKQLLLFMLLNPIVLSLFYLSLNISFIRKFIIKNIIYRANKNYHSAYKQHIQKLQNYFNRETVINNDNRPLDHLLDIVKEKYNPKDFTSDEVSGGLFYFGEKQFEKNKDSVIYVMGYLQGYREAIIQSLVCSSKGWCHKYYQTESVNTFIWIQPTVDTINDWSSKLQEVINFISTQTDPETKITAHATSMGAPVALDACSSVHEKITQEVKLVTFLPLVSLDVAVSDFCERNIGFYAAQYMKWAVSLCLKKIDWSLDIPDLLEKFPKKNQIHYIDPGDFIVGNSFKIYNDAQQEAVQLIIPKSDNYEAPKSTLNFSDWLNTKNSSSPIDILKSSNEKKHAKELWHTAYKSILTKYTQIAHFRSPSDFEEISTEQKKRP